jgi:RND family efflux transporter MFP subunit
MRTHQAVASLLTLAIATAIVPASAEGQPQSSRDPNRYLSNGEPDWAASFAGIRVFTDPVLDAQMGFSFPTEIREVLVKGGQRVVEGDLLIRAKDAESVAAEKIQRKRSENRLPIDAAEVGLKILELEYQGANEAYKQGGGSALERDQAKARRDRAQIELELAKENFAEQALLLERATGELNRFRLHAPFDGVIESVAVDPGQSVSESQPALRIVKLDRLKARVPTPTRLVMERSLKPGDPAWVAMDLPGEPRVFLGQIVEVSPVADFPSQTTNVWVEIENTENRPAGLTAWVRFSEPTGVWAQRIVMDRPGAGGAEPSINASEDSLVVGAADEAGTNR